MIKPMSESTRSRKPPYLAKQITRHGRVMWYVRKGKMRVRLRADYGSAAFWEEYMAALAATRGQRARCGVPRTGPWRG